MKRLIAAVKRRPVLSLAVIASTLVVLVVGAVAGTAYTSKPAFCTSCHEMSPYYAAWNEGAHASVDCVACHVDPGLKAEVSHKFVALKEVYNHFTTDPKFPGAVSDVPDSRCVACHDGPIGSSIPGFDHEAHRSDKPCVECHTNAGHKVTSVALADAGILDTAGMKARELRDVAARGAGSANVAGHVAVACTDCHDLAKTGCVTCHDNDQKEHPALASVNATATGPATSCTSCHTDAAQWAFTHPAPTVVCVACHTAPTEHRRGLCATCHETGVSWKFTHPASSATCTSCHTRPAGHATATCVTCHTTGVSWKFQHPSSASCSNCHAKPAKHYAGTCSTCHSPKVAFSKATFRHPGSAATCTNCHKRPSGHSSTKCSTCHKTGVSWRFTHPSSKSCSSCHKAPSSHYGSTCSSCHSSSRSWGSATFKHPSVPGGEHTYRSFTCTKCHPSGYSSTACTTCHESGGSDD